MATVIRTSVSRKNRYWISKYRFLELKNFCMQYDEWKERLKEMGDYLGGCMSSNEVRGTDISDPVPRLAEAMIYFNDRIRMVENAAEESDAAIGKYILKGVTQGVSYEALNARETIPCGKDYYYGVYRRFFWLLDKMRN